MRRLLGPALALLILVPLAGPADAADDPPVLHVVSDPGTRVPLKLQRYDAGDPPLPPGACDGVDCEDDANVFATVTSTEPADVTVTVTSAEGLHVDPMVQDLGTVRPTTYGYGVAAWSIAATTPGFHTLTYEVAADGAEPVEVSLPYLWLPGGPRLAGHDSLQGRVFALQGRGYYQCGIESDCTYRYTKRIEFVDHTRAHRALADAGHVTCTGAAPCSSYRYDEATGLVQVGATSIGRVTDGGLVLDNETYLPLAYPASGARLRGTWSHATDVDDYDGVGRQRLRLTKGGRFVLTYTVDTTQAMDPADGNHVTVRLSGTYRLGKHGRLVLTDPRAHRSEIATLALLTDAQGRPRGSERGVWLDLAIDPRHGKDFVDGNRLTPVS